MGKLFATDSKKGLKKGLKKGTGKLKRWKKQIELKAKRDEMRDRSNRSTSPFGKQSHYFDGFEFILPLGFNPLSIEKEASSQKLIQLLVNTISPYGWNPKEGWTRENAIFFTETELEIRMEHQKEIEKYETFSKYHAGQKKIEITKIDLTALLKITIDNDLDAYLMVDLHIVFKNAGRTEESNIKYEVNAIKEQLKSALETHFKYTGN